MLRDEVVKYREREVEIVDEKRSDFADNFVRSGHSDTPGARIDAESNDHYCSMR